MKCPFCSAEDTQVIDSRVSEEGDSIRRRRRCQVCNKRFTTYETAELRMPQIVKTDGVREDFSSAKLRTGFQRALLPPQLLFLRRQSHGASGPLFLLVLE